MLPASSHWLPIERWPEAVAKVREFELCSVDPQGKIPLASGGTTDFKLELRLMCSAPRSIPYFGQIYADAIGRLECDLLVNIPHGVSPIVSKVAEILDKRFIVMRESMRPDQKPFIGTFSPGEKCVVIDDVMAGGTTKAGRIKRLQEAGLIVVAVVVFVDRNEGWRELFAKEGINVPVWSGMPYEFLRESILNG